MPQPPGYLHGTQTMSGLNVITVQHSEGGSLKCCNWKEHCINGKELGALFGILQGIKKCPLSPWELLFLQAFHGSWYCCPLGGASRMLHVYM